MNTDNLIDLLAEDLLAGAPGKALPLARILQLAIAGAVLAAASVFFLCLGLRADIAEALRSTRFLFKFVVTLTLAVGAAGATVSAARPDGAVAGWRFVLGAVPVLLMGAAGLELMAVPGAAWMTRLVGHNAQYCLTMIPLLALGPLACLLAALRRGAPASPRLAGALAGLAASGIAATFYAADCDDDSPLFVATWYSFATAIVVAAGCYGGHRFLRW